MIQEMYAVSGLLAAEAGHPKISSTINRSIPESSAATSTTVTAAAAATSNSKSQNLRCPRCESSNTKFCYYNNYNLTQPRHFCKTCRRYWTKGGALRNVPIGGGCRKNKSAAAGKMIKTASSSTVEILGRVGSGLDREIISSPTQILWGSPQNSQLLAILRSAGARNQNPSPNNNNNNNNNLAGCHVINESPATSFQARTTMGFDPTNHISSLGLCSSYWRNSQSQVLYQPNGYVHGGGGGQVTGGGGGIQELYQKLIKSSSSSGNYFSDGQQGSMGTAAPVGGGETTGYWNPSFSLSDVHASAANGAYP